VAAYAHRVLELFDSSLERLDQHGFLLTHARVVLSRAIGNLEAQRRVFSL
jgi:hypothetical protein